MDDLGHIYVLANSAMPGMVKVGKTTRSPTERAIELSGVTGLPTPFIVVYEQLFQNCSVAETFVHTYLGQQGFRVSDNREFFNAPVNEVVRAVNLAPGSISNNMTSLESDPLLEHCQSDGLDSLHLDTNAVSRCPWSSIFQEAEQYYYGLDNYLEDYAEALRLFRQAAKLGSLPAYGYIGEIYERGKGVRQEQEKALEYYKEGARKGSVYCYWAMGSLFIKGDSQQNAEKCFSLFVNNINTTLPDGQRLTKMELSNIIAGCVILLADKVQYGKELPKALNSFIDEKSLVISSRAQNFIEMCRTHNDPSGALCYVQVIEHLKSLTTARQ